jgi:hypothetical protein
MRCTFLIAWIVVAGLAGCGDKQTDPATKPKPPPPVSETSGTQPPAVLPQTPADKDAGKPKEFSYAPGLPIPVTLTMKPADSGGRAMPFYDSYRATIKFAGSEPAHLCLADLGTLRQFGPGETHDVGLACTDQVVIRENALDLTVQEGGHEVGSGKVRP